MAINGSALRAFSRLHFHSFSIQIGLTKCHWRLTPSLTFLALSTRLQKSLGCKAFRHWKIRPIEEFAKAVRFFYKNAPTRASLAQLNKGGQPFLARLQQTLETSKQHATTAAKIFSHHQLTLTKNSLTNSNKRSVRNSSMPSSPSSLKNSTTLPATTPPPPTPPPPKQIPPFKKPSSSYNPSQKPTPNNSNTQTTPTTPTTQTNRHPPNQQPSPRQSSSHRNPPSPRKSPPTKEETTTLTDHLKS